MTRALVILLLLTLSLFAETVRVSWLANPEPDIDRYQVMRNGAEVAETMETAADIEAVAGDEIRIVAINTAGMASDPSDAAVVPASVDAPTRRRITIKRSDTRPYDPDGSIEAVLYQTHDGPLGFWWAVIETED